MPRDHLHGKAAVATTNVYKDGTVEIQNGVQDLGTGIATVLAQIGAEVARLPPHLPVPALQLVRQLNSVAVCPSGMGKRNLTQAGSPVMGTPLPLG